MWFDNELYNIYKNITGVNLFVIEGCINIIDNIKKWYKLYNRKIFIEEIYNKYIYDNRYMR